MLAQLNKVFIVFGAHPLLEGMRILLICISVQLLLQRNYTKLNRLLVYPYLQLALFLQLTLQSFRLNRGSVCLVVIFFP